MTPGAKDNVHGRDGVGVASLEPVVLEEQIGRKTLWSIGRWNRRGIRCIDRHCRHEIVEVAGRQYDPYDEQDGLVFASKGKALKIERHAFRVLPAKGLVLPRPHHFTRDNINVYVGRQPFKPGVITLGAGGLTMRCPCCNGLMRGFSPDYDEGRLPDCVGEEGALEFFDFVHGNLLLNEGITEALNCISNENSPISYQNSTAQVGTGTSATAAGATDTDLGANGVWKAMDGVYPTVASQTCSWKGTYGTGDANQAWAEFSLRNSSGDDLNLNRKVESKGTKSSGTWTLQIDITLS